LFGKDTVIKTVTIVTATTLCSTAVNYERKSVNKIYHIFPHLEKEKYCGLETLSRESVQ